MEPACFTQLFRIGGSHKLLILSSFQSVDLAAIILSFVTEYKNDLFFYKFFDFNVFVIHVP